MPPLPMSSMISSCGKSLRISSTGGASNLEPPAPVVPGSVPVTNPDLIRHSGQRPNGTSAANGLWQLGQVRSASITLITPHTKEIKGGEVARKVKGIIRSPSGQNGEEVP